MYEGDSWMKQHTIATSAPVQSPVIAWRNALGIVLLLWLLLGLLNFGFVTNYLASTMPHNLLLASFYLDISFGITMVVIVGLIVLWQRRHGESLADLGWRRPTTAVAVICAIVFGALWVISTYLREPHPVQSFLALSWERPIMMLIGLCLAFGEELAMRGFFMEQLRRGGIPTWLQVVSCAAFMGGYHGIVGLHYSLLYGLSSMVLFGIVAIIFVIGRRSLTPGTIAHAMSHFFGDPVLTMGILHGALLLATIH
jgi:Type II CAAX prenyl endopeptidase Rce1-like